MGVAFRSLILLVLGITGCKSELEAILANSRLPETTVSIGSVYDGFDSIYLFGGLSTNDWLNTIHRYDISTDTLFPSVASFSDGRYGGGLAQDSSGNMFYFSGSKDRDVFKFNPSTSELTEVAELNSRFYMSSVIPTEDPNIALLIGGDYSTQYAKCFNMSSATLCGQTELAGGTKLQTNSGFAVKDKAFFFSDYLQRKFATLNLTSMESTIVENTGLPFYYFPPNVVTDGRYGYLIGGHWGTDTPVNSLTKFDPETLQSELIHVEMDTVWGNDSTFAFSSSVYVEKLNRIYIFGGTAADSLYHDEIWYIDLPTTTDPTSTIATSSTSPVTTEHTDTTASTTAKPDGNCTEDGFYFVPYPEDCSKYMVCFHHQLLPDFHTCPPNTLFDPVLGECNDEDLVPCEPVCPSNSSLIYIPHRNCSLYWICFWGEIELRTCPENMVFDPQMNNCNYKEFVFCPNRCPMDIPIANFPHESDCSKYWHCVNGVPTLISCPGGEFYDPDLERCSRDPVDCANQF